MPAAPVVTAAALEKDVSAGQLFVGEVMPARRSVIGSAVDGRVVELGIDVGDEVAADAPLARLRTQTLEIELAGAKAELEVRRQLLAELENGSRPQEIEQAKALMEAAAAQKQLAEVRLVRTRELIETRAVTDDALDDAIAVSRQASENYTAAGASFDLITAGPRPEKVAQAKAAVDVQAEAVRRIEDLLAKHTMVSPFDGFVVRKLSEVGQWIKSGEPVAEVVELSQVDVEVNVLEDHIPHLEVGDEARIEIPALPGEPFVGSVSRVVPQADPRSRTFPVRIRLENRKVGSRMLLNGGMLARVTLAVGKTESAVLVPKDALVLSGASAQVVVVRREGTKRTAHRVPVSLGVAELGWIQVSGDLAAGDEVVVEGNERLRDGQEVTILKQTGT
jgi:multidrug efflux pump subunit AcrA (membrane-fusion protein)